MCIKIDHSIPTQGFEFVRDRIGNILYTELSNQVYRYNDDALEAKVTVETNNPYVDNTELSKVQVCMANGAYSNKHIGVVDGTYQYIIDVSCAAKAKKDVDPATRATYKLHRLTGAIRYILEHPVYKTLAFAPGFIKRVYMSNFDVLEQEKNDMLSIASTRCVFTVELVENAKLFVPKLIEGYDTVVNLGDTTEGYRYIGENY